MIVAVSGEVSSRHIGQAVSPTVLGPVPEMQSNNWCILRVLVFWIGGGLMGAFGGLWVLVLGTGGYLCSVLVFVLFWTFDNRNLLRFMVQGSNRSH